MKLLAWNLNHQAARRQIPSWIAAAINEQAPDILVLTEFASLAGAVLTVATAPVCAERCAKLAEQNSNSFPLPLGGNEFGIGRGSVRHQ